MSDFTEKVRAMLGAASAHGNWIHNGDGTIWHTGGPGGQISHAFFELTDAEVAAESPRLLREACERIEALEELYEIVRWEKECEDFQRPPSRKFQTHLGHIPWLDAKKAKENWQSKGWRSLARIYGNSWQQKQDALSILDAPDAPRPTPELVPVYPGPDLKRGDIVYTPSGRRAEVYNIDEDKGTFTSQGQFCASVLRREKMAADAEGK